MECLVKLYYIILILGVLPIHLHAVLHCLVAAYGISLIFQSFDIDYVRRDIGSCFVFMVYG